MAWLLRMPEVAANAAEAVLAEWPVPENVPFSTEDAIATVETEKAVVDVPADADGVILRFLVAPGAEVEVGAPIAVLGASGEAVEDLDALLAELGVVPAAAPGHPAPEAASVAPEVPPAQVVAQTAVPAVTQHGATDPNGRVFASPLARRLAREAGLAVQDVTGTGPGGRIVRRDVQRAVAAEPATTPVAGPPPAAAFEEVPHTPMRRAIAERLTHSARDAPHFYVRGTARVDELLRARGQLNEAAAVKVTLNDLVVAAAARAHVLVPAMNVRWTPDAVRTFSSVDIALAVATERGLVTPVLRGVDQLRIYAVAEASADLVARARAGRLRQEELEGGTLTVTNLGTFGTEDFAAIINPPQSAILAVGAARQEPVVDDAKLSVGTVMHVTLSVDHRPVDGVVAARWMAAFLELLQSPVRLLA